MTQTSTSNTEPVDPGDHVVAVVIKGSDWEALTGEGLAIPGPSRLQLVAQHTKTAGGWPTYGVRIVAP